jgi:hypothetical protein
MFDLKFPGRMRPTLRLTMNGNLLHGAANIAANIRHTNQKSEILRESQKQTPPLRYGSSPRQGALA